MKGMKKGRGSGTAMRMKQIAIVALILVAFVCSTSLALAAELTIEPCDITPGIPVNITGTGFDPNETVTVTTTVTCWKPVSDGKCECTMVKFEILEGTIFKLSVREVKDNVTLYLKRLGIWWTVNPDTSGFFTFEYTGPPSNTSNVTSGKIPTLFAGTYSIDVIGDAVSGKENCTMITSAELEVTADEYGNFTMKDVKTQGIPICNFSITAKGKISGTSAGPEPLNISIPGDASKDGRVSAYDCVCIARYCAGISGYDNSTLSYSAAAGITTLCDEVDINDARYLARYLIGKETSMPDEDCSSP